MYEEKIIVKSPLSFHLHNEDGTITIIDGVFEYEVDREYIKTETDTVPKEVDVYYGDIPKKGSMEIFLGARMSGKTTRVIDTARRNLYAFIIVPSIDMKYAYPRDLHDRIYSIRQERKSVLKHTPYIIDEPEFMPYELLKEIDEDDILLIAGTPICRKIGEKSWFKEMCEKYEYTYHKTTMDDTNLARMRERLSHNAYMTEFLCAFISVPEGI
jgi:hypothetical protein